MCPFTFNHRKGLKGQCNPTSIFIKNLQNDCLALLEPGVIALSLCKWIRVLEVPFAICQNTQKSWLISPIIWKCFCWTFSNERAVCHKPLWSTWIRVLIEHTWLDLVPLMQAKWRFWIFTPLVRGVKLAVLARPIRASYCVVTWFFFMNVFNVSKN